MCERISAPCSSCTPLPIEEEFSLSLSLSLLVLNVQVYNMVFNMQSFAYQLSGASCSWLSARSCCMHAAANYKTAFSVATPKAAATCQAAWMYGVSGKKPSATNNAPPKSDDAACHLCASRNCGFSKVLSANVAYIVIHPSIHLSIHHQFLDNNFQFAENNFQFVENNFQFAVNKHCCSSPLQKLNFEAGSKGFK